MAPLEIISALRAGGLDTVTSVHVYNSLTRLLERREIEKGPDGRYRLPKQNEAPA